MHFALGVSKTVKKSKEQNLKNFRNDVFFKKKCFSRNALTPFTGQLGKKNVPSHCIVNT